MNVTPPPAVHTGTLRDYELMELQRQAEEGLGELFKLPEHLKEKVGAAGRGWGGGGGRRDGEGRRLGG